VVRILVVMRSPARRAALALLLLVVAGAACGLPHRGPTNIAKVARRGVILTRRGERVALDNGYVRVELSLAHPQIDVLQGDVTGDGHYGGNVVAGGSDSLYRAGIVLERQDAGQTQVHASSLAPSGELALTVLRDDGDVAAIRVGPLVDDVSDPMVASTWTLTLPAASRAVRLDTDNRVLRQGEIASIRVATYLSTPSLHGLFERGVLQTMGGPSRQFASRDRMHRFYALGGGAADVVSSGAIEHVLLAADSAFYRSALHEVLAGAFVERDKWSSHDWAAAKPTHVSLGDHWATTATIAINNQDFPTAALPLDTDIDPEDLRALYTAVYGTTVASLVSYELPGEIAATVGFPDRGYWPGLNFFDPDAWMSVCALVYSGDMYLQREARKLIETSGARILPTGQVPHHFNESEPTYVAISGATQTGPNVFWISAALQYAKSTGDYTWLRTQMPAVEQAMKFLTDRFDPKVNLVNAPGPLWIDVFIRNSFTADTNAFMVRLLRDVADAEAFVGQAEVAEGRRRMATTIAAAMNDRLWADDHYVTQLNPDGSTRDFIDYDSNLLAVAFGVAPPDRAAKILARVDRGKCTHGRATFVSETYYDRKDCYLENIGDSDIAMERIGWADGHARRAVGDIATFEKLVLNPVRDDLIARTWLTERYDCAGRPTRKNGFHGYPEMVVMLLREVAYGIDIGFGEVSIAPFGRSRFHYHVGNVDVAHSPQRVVLRIPGSGEKRFNVAGLLPKTSYDISVGGRSEAARVADAEGALSFVASYSAGEEIRLAAVGERLRSLRP
jgi:hypothetical protein